MLLLNVYAIATVLNS